MQRPMVLTPCQRFLIANVPTLIILENGDRFLPRRVGRFDIKVHIPRFRSPIFSARQVEGVVRTADHRGISTSFTELYLVLPLGYIVWTNRTPVSEGVMVRVINDMKVSQTVYRQRRPRRDYHTPHQRCMWETIGSFFGPTSGNAHGSLRRLNRAMLRAFCPEG